MEKEDDYTQEQLFEEIKKDVDELINTLSNHGISINKAPLELKTQDESIYAPSNNQAQLELKTHAYTQEQLFEEIKNDIDEFIYALSNNQPLLEFKAQVNTMFHNLETQYNIENMDQRTIMDIRRQLKTDVKQNKKEVIKSIEDDLERL